jgi:hypothetical protein
MTTARALLAELRELGLVVWAEDDRLRFRGPAGALTAALRTRMQAMKPRPGGTRARQWNSPPARCR